MSNLLRKTDRFEKWYAGPTYYQHSIIIEDLLCILFKRPANLSSAFCYELVLDKKYFPYTVYLYREGRLTKVIWKGREKSGYSHYFYTCARGLNYHHDDTIVNTKSVKDRVNDEMLWSPLRRVVSLPFDWDRYYRMHQLGKTNIKHNKNRKLK